MSVCKAIKNRLRLSIWKCTLTDRQLQKKFNKHANAFGVSGNYNPANREKFKQAILNHLLDKNTVLIKGTYRNQPVNHYYNKVTKLNVICRDKNFLSGWHLGAAQEYHLLTRGSLR